MTGKAASVCCCGGGAMTDKSGPHDGHWSHSQITHADHWITVVWALSSWRVVRLGLPRKTWAAAADAARLPRIRKLMLLERKPLIHRRQPRHASVQRVGPSRPGVSCPSSMVDFPPCPLRRLWSTCSGDAARTRSIGTASSVTVPLAYRAQ